MSRTDSGIETSRRQEGSLPKGVRCPWGEPDLITRYADGILRVITPGHGGFYLSNERLKQMPEALFEAANGRWFEEDCEWCLVALSFPDEFTSEEQEFARKTLKNWYPEAYEKFYDVKLGRGESYMRDQQIAEQENRDRMVVISAKIDEEDRRLVCVLATRGGQRDPSAEKRWFLVDAEEYSNRPQTGFVIDEDRHEEVDETRFHPPRAPGMG